MKIDGACHCGRITFEAEIDPEQAVICHCTDCQSMSGSAYRALVPAARRSFRLTSGRPKRYVKTADSGNRRVQAFCPECGTSIYSAPEDAPEGVAAIRLGAVRQREQLTPRRQIWCDSAQAWAQDLSDIPKVARQ